MDILIHADGVNLTEALKDAIDEKVGHVEQYAPRAVRARVRLRKATAHHSARQFTVRVLIENPGAAFSAEESRDDVITALDMAVGKIERQLRKRKTERLARREQGPRRKP